MDYQAKILAFAGSVRKASFNKMLVKIAAGGAQAAGAKVTYVDLEDFPMPIYNADLEAADGLPENALKFRSLLKENDGFIIASPEYNSSITPLLKNVIDWASRPLPGEPTFACFAGKVAAVVAASTGPFGGIRSVTQLRAILENLKVLVLPDQKTIPRAREAFNADGSLNDEAARQSTEAVGARLAAVIEKLRG